MKSPVRFTVAHSDVTQLVNRRSFGSTRTQAVCSLGITREPLARWRRDSLGLRCWTLSFLSPCRFIPAHTHSYDALSLDERVRGPTADASAAENKESNPLRIAVQSVRLAMPRPQTPGHRRRYSERWR